MKRAFNTACRAASRTPFQAQVPLRRAFASTARRLEEQRKWSTPLAKQLFEAISTTGVVPLASYMRMCLTGDVGGYYTGAIGQGRDQFGTKGDFVTSPEISQMFGELIAVWFIAEWMSQGKPKQGVQLVEIGPGRGTLMDDMLRTIQSFPPMAKAIDAVYMVETSKQLQQSQRERLCGSQPSVETEAGFQSTSKYGQTPIFWTESIKAVPSSPEAMPFIIAHEFFDALPIHTFQSAKAPSPRPKQGSAAPPAEPAKPTMEWREMMVSPTPPGITHADLNTPTSQRDSPVPEFQLTLSPGTTRHSRFLPESSPRYQALKQTEGAVVEICPDAAIYTADFAARIGGSPRAPKAKPSGAALILDYGTADTIPVNSLRGIRQHKLVSPFAEPGLVDLSADVDFAAVAEAATLASEGVEVHGPICQADFLELMGIRERSEVLIKNAGGNKDVAESIEKAWKRLVDRGPSGMGKVYKALAILPENDGKRRPVGFGGDIM